VTKQEKLFLYWLGIQTKHVIEYAQAYKKISRKKGKVSKKLQKETPGWTNLLAYLEVTALASSFREREYRTCAGALQFAKDAFERSLEVKDGDIEKVRRRLREFARKNKPKELELKIE